MNIWTKKEDNFHALHFLLPKKQNVILFFHIFIFHGAAARIFLHLRQPPFLFPNPAGKKILPHNITYVVKNFSLKMPGFIPTNAVTTRYRPYSYRAAAAFFFSIRILKAGEGSFGKKSFKMLTNRLRGDIIEIDF